MKKTLVVLLVLLTATCLFASDFSFGAKFGITTGGTSELSIKDSNVRDKLTYTAIAMGVEGTYAIDNNYSIEGDFMFQIPIKATYGDLISKNRKEFKKGFGFKADLGFGYVLRVDSAVDFKVGGGFTFNSVSFKKSTVIGADKVKTFGIYGFGKAAYPVMDKLDVVAELNVDLALYGKITNGSQVAKSLAFKPNVTAVIGAVYHI